MVQIVQDVVPTLPHLRFSVDVGEVLTDELLGVALQAGSHVCSLSAWEPKLKSAQHANTPCPWDELEFTCVSLANVLGLPSAQGRAPCTIRTHDVFIDTHITEVGPPLCAHSVYAPVSAHVPVACKLYAWIVPCSIQR